MHLSLITGAVIAVSQISIFDRSTSAVVIVIVIVVVYNRVVVELEVEIEYL